MALAIVTAISLSSFAVLFALAFTLPLRVGKMWNFGLGGFITLAAYLMNVIIVQKGLPPLIGISIAVVVLAGLGWVFDWYLLNVLRRRRAHFFTLFIVSIMVTTLFIGLAELVFGDTPIALTQVIFQMPVHVLGVDVQPRGIYGVAMSAVLSALIIILMKTTWGKQVDAVASNALLSVIHQLNVRKIRAAVMAISAALVVFGTYIVGVSYTISPDSGLTYMLGAVLGSLLGGAGNISGAIVGAIVATFVEQIAALWIPGDWSLFVTYVALFIAVSAFSRGIYPTVGQNVPEEDDAWAM